MNGCKFRFEGIVSRETNQKDLGIYEWEYPPPGGAGGAGVDQLKV